MLNINIYKATNINGINLNMSIDEILSYIEEILGKEDFYQIYKYIIVDRDADKEINVFLKVVFIAGVIKGKQESNNILKELKGKEK